MMTQAQLDFTHDGDALQIARRKLLRELPEGTTCPCCGQFAKTYKRKLNSQMARFLIGLLHAPTDCGGWAKTRDFLPVGQKASTDGTYLVHWELIERKKHHSGVYAITAKGRRFATGQIRVPRHVFLYDGRRLGFSDDSTSITGALGNQFDYHELMSTRQEKTFDDRIEEALQ